MGVATDRPYGQDGGVVQLPLAIEKILQGESPYGADYSGTALVRQARASTFWEPLGGNPILRHRAYLPGTHLVMLPAYLVSRAAFGFFDPRFVTLLFLTRRPSCWPIGSRTAWTRAWPRRAWPPSTHSLWWQQVFGANDIVFVAMLLLGGPGSGLRGCLVAAGACLGLACATKQLAWPFAPFLLAGLSGAGSLRELSRCRCWRLCGPVGVGRPRLRDRGRAGGGPRPRGLDADAVRYNVGLPGGDNYPLGGTPGFGFANFSHWLRRREQPA